MLKLCASLNTPCIPSDVVAPNSDSALYDFHWASPCFAAAVPNAAKASAAMPIAMPHGPPTSMPAILPRPLTAVDAAGANPLRPSAPLYSSLLRSLRLPPSCVSVATASFINPLYFNWVTAAAFCPAIRCAVASPPAALTLSFAAVAALCILF